MITLKTPYEYIGGSGILAGAGKRIRKLGAAAYVIGGKTALKEAGPSLLRGLAASDMRYAVGEFSGYPTRAAIDRFAGEVRASGSEVVVAVGGGKVMDTSKCVGQTLGLPVVAVPTIAATCAAWAAVSILYTEEGSFAGVQELDNSPRLVLADFTLIANAPARYLSAGIADTIAKWYETEPNLRRAGDLSLRLQVKTAELALETLEKKAHGVLDAVRLRHPSRDLPDVVDAVILLAGLVGSTKADHFFGGFAHPFYNSITRIPETRDKLHGEKVSFGLLAQTVLENKSDAQRDKLLGLLLDLDQPVTLAQLGIVSDVRQKIETVADGLGDFISFYKAPDHRLTRDEIVDAIFRADEIGRATLRNHKRA